MNRFSLGYYPKNVPVPSEKEYTLTLLEKTEELFKRMRWKAFFYNNRNETQQDYQTAKTYGLRTKKSPPSINELKGFENDLISLIKNIEYKKTRSKFQNKLKSDVLKINESNEIIVAADKTNNMYKMSYENYDKLLSENITQKYKKEKHQTAASIVNECKSIAKKLHIENRLRPTIEKPAFITIKDHKENFENNMKCRLINPTKT